MIKEFWKKFIYALKKLCMITLLVIIMLSLMIKESIAPSLQLSETAINERIYNTMTELLVKEVSDYIKTYGPESSVSAERLVEISDLYDMDLELMLAQAHLESHFGTRGLATITNSVFNVGAYDNGKILCTYEEPNESIEPYARLITKYYLVDNKSVDDLLTTKFVNYKGKRYASNKKYEIKLIEIMNLMSQTTRIDDLLSERYVIKTKLDSLYGISKVEEIVYMAYEYYDDEYFNLKY